MRRITVLLMVMASVLLATSGIAWAVTKTCPSYPKKCLGTKGADVLKSTSKNNFMMGKGGNDTYTHFVSGNSAHDHILDTGGKDKLLLRQYWKSEVKASTIDWNNNGKVDALGLWLGKGTKNTVLLRKFYNDTKVQRRRGEPIALRDVRKPPFKHGPGYIEIFRYGNVRTVPLG